MDQAAITLQDRFGLLAEKPGETLDDSANSDKYKFGARG
jgi:hypothetical protein